MRIRETEIINSVVVFMVSKFSYIEVVNELILDCITGNQVSGTKSWFNTQTECAVIN